MWTTPLWDVNQSSLDVEGPKYTQTKFTISEFQSFQISVMTDAYNDINHCLCQFACNPRRFPGTKLEALERCSPVTKVLFECSSWRICPSEFVIRR